MELKLNHIHLRSADYEAAAQWFVDVLDGEILAVTEVPGMPIIRVGLGGQVVACSPKREEMEVEPNSGSPRWGVWQLGYEVDDIRTVAEDVKARGGEFSLEPKEIKPGMTVAFLKGPDGLEIELMQID